MKKIIETKKANNPIGPYSQGVLSGNTLYTSGQIAMDPKSEKLVLENIQVETLQVMKNLQAILEEADMSFEDVIKTSIFISNMDDFTIINSVYENYFQTKFPARETIEVARLPMDVHVEISMIAQK
jgi:2-iminobutanoate/2-iminopropanoate deaminase